MLLAKRPSHKANAGLWEFPGGKVEAGESHWQALTRELAEELAISVQLHEALPAVSSQRIQLHGYLVSLSEGEPQALEHDALAWLTWQQTALADLCPADLILITESKTAILSKLGKHPK